MRKTQPTSFTLRCGRTAAVLLVGIALLWAAPVVASDWKAPADADGYSNPTAASAQSIAAGKKVYAEHCVFCHGESGQGDGPTSRSLTVKPANLADKGLIGSQSDGALAWKILTGRGPMPSWAPVLEEPQVWDLVNYIRSLSK